MYGSMETREDAGWKYGDEKLEITKPLPGASGRFADLKLGQLMLKGGLKKTVVVKMNKGLYYLHREFLQGEDINILSVL